MLRKHLSRLNAVSLKNFSKSNNLPEVCFPLKSLGSTSIRNYNSVSSVLDEEKSRLFFSKEAQRLMKKITGLDLEKVYQRRTTGAKRVAPPRYEFMTNEQLKTAQTNAVRRAYRKLQMPPLIPLNKQETKLLDEDPQMIGFTKSNYIFTDISFNVSDRKRLIVVREPSGVLRTALPYERHRMNELYFPRPGRSYEHPKMFQKENLRRLLDKKDYEFVLDRACAQFEPDDEEYHDTVFATFDAINKQKDFEKLRSTRHFGPMVFYLCLTKNVTNLIEHNLETENLDDAYDVTQLYCLINPDCKFLSLNMNSEDKIEYLRKFIEYECAESKMSLQLLDTYWEAQKNPMNRNIG